MSKKYNNSKEFWEDNKGNDSRNFEDLSSLEQANQESGLAAYNQKSFLEDTYGNALKELDQSKYNQQRSAYFQNQKLLKYLPENLKRQGLAGLGISNQAYLDASNNYNNTLANINSEYNSSKNNLFQTYNQGVLDIENNERSERLANEDKYYTRAKNEEIEAYNRARNEEADAYNKSTNMYNDTYAHLLEMYSYLADENDKLSYEGKKKLDDYFEANSKYMVDEHKAALKSYLDTLEKSYTMNEDGSYTTKNADGSTTTTNKDGSYSKTFIYEGGKITFDYNENGEIAEAKEINGKRYMEYNDNVYEIKQQLTHDSKELTNNDFKNQLKEKFGVTNSYDYRIPNGATLNIKLMKVVGAKHKHTISEGRTMTYYNGEWYLSEKK